jgi:CheY-like chemotaxis protein
VIDDTPDNLRLLSAMLTAQEFEVRQALSGKELFNHLLHSLLLK